MSKNLNAGPLGKKALEFVSVMNQIHGKGREPGFAKDDWQPLTEFVEVKDFVRTGPFHDTVNWSDYLDLLTAWVTNSEGWTPVVKRINEAPGVVYIDCEEQIIRDGGMSPFYSLSVYEFNEAGKITTIDVYMQQANS